MDDRTAGRANHDHGSEVTLAARLAAMREEHRPRREVDGEACRLVCIGGVWCWLGADRPVAGLLGMSEQRHDHCNERWAELEIDAAQRKALLDKAWRLLLDEDGEVGVYISLDIARMYPSLHAAYTAVFGDAREGGGR